MLGYSDSNKESGLVAAAWMLHQAQSSAGRGGPGAGRRADAVPRPRRRARARRRADQPGDPRPGAGLGRRAAQADRAGRGDRRQLRRPDDRAAPPRADDRRDPAGLDAGARRPARARPGRRRADHGRAGRDVPGRVPRARPRRPGLRLVLPRHHARSASCPTCGSGRGRRRAVGATRRRRSIRCGRSRGPSPGRRRGSTCPAGSGWATRSRRTGAAHGEAGLDAIARLARDWPFLSSLLDNAEMSLAKADMGVARLVRGARHRPGRRPALGRRSRPNTGGRSSLLARVTGRERLLDGAPVLQRVGRAPQPVRRLAVRAPGPAAGPAARACRRTTPTGQRVLRLVQLTVNGVAAGLQSTG